MKIAATEFLPYYIDAADEAGLDLLREMKVLPDLFRILVKNIQYSRDELSHYPVDDVSDSGVVDKVEDVRPIIRGCVPPCFFFMLRGSSCNPMTVLAGLMRKMPLTLSGKATMVCGM